MKFKEMISDLMLGFSLSRDVAKAKRKEPRFKVRKDLLGIVLAFVFLGLVTSGLDANAYHNLATNRTPQVNRIKAALSSEFISSADKKLLVEELATTNAAEKKATRSQIEEQTTAEKKLLAAVQKRMNSLEAKHAESESIALKTELSELAKKSGEKFILADDVDQLEKLNTSFEQLSATKKVKPIRALAVDVGAFSEELSGNQAEMIETVSEMKTLNQTANDLTKKKYVMPADKTSLANAQKENEKYFEDADNLTVVIAQKDTSKNLIAEIQTKQADTEKDFKANEAKSTALVKATNGLLSTGTLTADEKTGLETSSALLAGALLLKNYQPGALATDYQALKTSYDTALTNSNKKIAEAKAKVAKEKAAQQAAAAQQQAQAASQKAAAKASPGAPTVSGGWTTAPAGYVYLKVESGKTYRSVKNPENYRRISNAEASGYSPGHSNGYARN